MRIIKNIYVIIWLMTLSLATQAQIFNPLGNQGGGIEKHTSWTITATPTKVPLGRQVTLTFEAQIDDGWYVYGSNFEDGVGPKITSLSLNQLQGFKKEGGLLSVKPKSKYDDIFEMTYTYFTSKATFKQVLVATQAGSYVVAGTLEYQECSEESGKCILHEEDFELNLTVTEGKANAQAPTAQTSQTKPAKPTTVASDTNKQPQQNSTFTTDSAAYANSHAKPADTATVANKVVTPNDPNATATPTPNHNTEGAISLWGFAVLAFLSGLVALLTPCVFPMIPMTVSFFTKQSGTRSKGIRQALIYGGSIVAIYTIAGSVIAKVNGPEFANWLSTHWLPNIMFTVVFLLFGLSFLGLFEIALPSSWVTKIDKQADRGGLTGVFFMAFTLVLASFSCTGPIVGTILVESAGGSWTKPIVGMFAFSMAFALPFTLFAIFPNWMKSLPQSGGWLNSVKVVLGFIELALSIKFLSVADQAYHWGLLDREVYLAIWIAVFGLLTLYLIGKLKLKGDTESKTVSVPRVLLGTVSLTFVVYMLPGLWGAPLKGLSGYLPPMHTQDFKGSNMATTTINPSNTMCSDPKFAEFLHFPPGLKGYFTLDEGLACAKEQGKPVFVDFTGHGCVNCRKMEEQVWTDPEVKRLLAEEYVLVSLFVDDKTKLSEDDWYTSSYDGKVKKTLGKQNADLQITRFKNNAQPLYILMNANQEILAPPRGYDSNVEAFVLFLEKGLENFKKQK